MLVKPLKSDEEFHRYVSFSAEVYDGNTCWVPADGEHLVGLFNGTSPATANAKVQPFCVEQDGKILATLTAVVENAYNLRWNEHTGHLLFFEALPGYDDAVSALFSTACDWLKAQQCDAARSAFLVTWQLPIIIDAYDSVPTFFHTFNPPYYHSYVKNAGFRTEHGAVQYQINFTPELARRYEEMVEHATRSGVSLRSIDVDRLEQDTALFTEVCNDAFSEHWGAHPVTAATMCGMTVGLRDFLVADFIVFAELDGETVGVVYSFPDLNQALHKMRGKKVEDNLEEFQQALHEIDHGALLIIGVRKQYRGKGINLALAGKCYLAMISRGYKTGSYTIVLDDNLPSRRTAEKLGGRVTRNSVVYRRELD